jgi:cytochrome c oxidase assembly protein subunit 15
MVKSGLIDRPDVSQYRLVAHLGLALLIYGCLLWVAFGLLFPPCAASPSDGFGSATIGIACLVLVTALAGGFVAGLDAGLAYNTFPLMDEELIPSQLFAATPAWRAFFEDVTTVQFTHRVLAIATLLAVLLFRWSLRGRSVSRRGILAANMLTVWVVAQFALGVATLLSMLALPLATLHQAGAVLLWSLALWCVFEFAGGAANRWALVPRADREAKRALV